MILTMVQFSNSKLNEYIKSPVSFDKDLQEQAEHFKDAIDTDKAWEAIHYLFNGTKLHIVWEKTQLEEANKPLSLIIYGDQHFDANQNLGLGPACYLTSNQVKQIHTIIDTLNEEYLKSKFDVKDMTSKGIYPTLREWKEDDFDYVSHHFFKVKDFYNKAAKRGNAIATFFC